MLEPKELRAEADKLYAKALDTENLDQRLKIVLRALELDVEAEVVERTTDRPLRTDLRICPASPGVRGSSP